MNPELITDNLQTLSLFVLAYSVYKINRKIYGHDRTTKRTEKTNPRDGRSRISRLFNRNRSRVGLGKSDRREFATHLDGQNGNRHASSSEFVKQLNEMRRAFQQRSKVAGEKGMNYLEKNDASQASYSFGEEYAYSACDHLVKTLIDLYEE